MTKKPESTAWTWKIICYLTLLIYSAFYIGNFILFDITGVPLPFTLRGVDPYKIEAWGYIELIVTLLTFTGLLLFAHSKYYLSAQFWKIIFVMLLLVSLNWLRLILESWLLDELPMLSFDLAQSTKYSKYMSKTLLNYHGIAVNENYFLLSMLSKYIKIFASLFVLIILYVYAFRRKSAWELKSKGEIFKFQQKIGYFCSLILIFSLIVVTFLRELGFVKISLIGVTVPLTVLAFSFYLIFKLPMDRKKFENKRDT
ncbi:hypothetical protein MNBD_GAMMA12-2927 [hydrothermal vent metagenome]|uniref:Uncharacterized protein n=1 Tax=hydrothermal vent metagenome TaxID=652676 RepID=A0A3B0YHR5_9ZZZZ